MHLISAPTCSSVYISSKYILMYLMRVDHFGLVIRILYTATSVSSIAASFLLFCTCITTLASTSSDYCHCCRYIHCYNHSYSSCCGRCYCYCTVMTASWGALLFLMPLIHIDLFPVFSRDSLLCPQTINTAG